MSASDWVIIIGAIFLGLTNIIQMILNFLASKDQKKDAAIIAKKVEEVKVQAAITTEKLETNAKEQQKQTQESLKISKATHILVNNNMMIQLEYSVKDKEKIVQLDDNSENREALELARKALDTHKRAQKEVDDKYSQQEQGK